MKKNYLHALFIGCLILQHGACVKDTPQEPISSEEEDIPVSGIVIEDPSNDAITNLNELQGIVDFNDLKPIKFTNRCGSISPKIVVSNYVSDSNSLNYPFDEIVYVCFRDSDHVEESNFCTFINLFQNEQIGSGTNYTVDFSPYVNMCIGDSYTVYGKHENLQVDLKLLFNNNSQNTNCQLTGLYPIDGWCSITAL